MVFLVIVAVVILVISLLYLIAPWVSVKKMDIWGGHVVVTGGSSGIGKAVAVDAVQRGASVTLLARNKDKLKAAKNEIEKHIKEGAAQKVEYISLDLAADYNAVEKAIKEAEEKVGPVDMLVNCAGLAVAGRFDELPLDQFGRMMEINYTGSLYATRAVIGGMKMRQRGRIVFTSSVAGQLGVYGYTGYSASKFALRGLAEALQMEVTPYNVRVCLAFPPDTDTPGFAEENILKPEETKLISESAGLFQPEYVAKAMMEDALAGKFNSYMGVDGWMVSCVTCGMSPVTNPLALIQQFCLMGIFRVISVGYLWSFDKIVARVKKEKDRTSEAKRE